MPFRDYPVFIGPFQFLIVCLFTSELLLAIWMILIKPDFYERIVIGAFSVTILIAILVIFCVIYSIKKNSGDFDKS